jgi:ABC-type Fe3+ transport system permease subunit
MPTTRDRSPTLGPALCAALVVAIAALCVGLPFAYALVASVTAEPPPGPATPAAPLMPALLRTLIAGSAIAALATVLAIPGAWVVREASPAGARRLALAIGVLMLPNYLAYAGLNLLRAPRTVLADWLAGQPPIVSVYAGYTIAVLGLALWAWPAAAFALGLSLRRVGQDQLDALDLAGAGPAARWRFMAGAVLPGFAAAFGVVFLLMLGSPVPLHVAQLDTYGVALWRRLTQTGDPARTWIAAWPVVLAAVGVAAIVVNAASRRLLAAAEPGPPPHAPRPRRGARAGLWVVLGVSLALPLVLHLRATAPPVPADTRGLHPASQLVPGAFSLSSVARTAQLFWHESAPAIGASALTGAMCAAVFALVALATWAAIACAPTHRRSLARTATILGVGVLLAASLSPGAVLGSATAGAWTTLPILRSLVDSPLPVVCVHTARFGAVAALLGVWAAMLEPPALRDLRRLDDPGSLRGFAALCVRPLWSVPVAAAIAGFVLSLHEIESTVFVQPPGSGNLAQQLLDALHFARDDRLGIAALLLAAASLALSYLGAWLITRPHRAPMTEP